MIAILKKELKLYFGNFLAYLVAGIFCVLSSLYLFYFENEFNILEIGVVSMSPFFYVAPWFLLFLVPAITMKTISEERSQGTLEWIFSKPISLLSFILGKFFSVLTVILFSLLSSLTIIYTLNKLSLVSESIDYGSILSGYIGLVLLCCCFISIGIFASSIMKNQISSFLLGVFLCFILYFGLEQLATYKFLGSFDYILQNIGLYYSYSSFVKGVVGIREVSYLIFITMLLLLISELVVKRK
ncbi:MAG: ABC transporter permease subunit [Flavobacteriales bacterium]|nr:ABC transporter permease subunit [Flavobacteriales bacterium]